MTDSTRIDINAKHRQNARCFRIKACGKTVRFDGEIRAWMHNVFTGKSLLFPCPLTASSSLRYPLISC
ncbi:DUF6434 domain-containing protein [Pseudomonas cerasi]